MTRSSADFAHLLDLLSDISVARLEREVSDHLNAWPRAASYDSARVGGHTTVTDDENVPMPALTDPTGETAINPDQARADLDVIEQETRELLRRARILWSVSQRYLPTTKPDAAQLAKLTETGEPGCEVMARIGHWYPVHRSTDFKGVFAHPLPSVIGVSRWVYDYARANGRLPTKAECRTYHDRPKTLRVKAS